MSKEEMRVTLANTLIDIIKEKNDKVIAIEADLGNSSKFNLIEKECPKNFINVGIAEANMIGVAAGMSLRDYIPFVHSFAPFATRRCYDQLLVSGGYANTNIKVIGSDPGVLTTYNGGSHTTFEDISLMRMIPNSMVFEPCDNAQLKWIIKELVDKYGVHYIRLNRKMAEHIYDEDEEFEIGKGKIIKTGKEVLLISMGSTLINCLNAANELEQENISVEVFDAFSLKPFDKELLINRVKGKKAVITVENHSIYGGLGSIVAEVLSESGCPIPLTRLGANEAYGEVGELDYLMKVYKIDKESIKSKIRSIF